VQKPHHSLWSAPSPPCTNAGKRLCAKAAAYTHSATSATCLATFARISTPSRNRGARRAAFHSLSEILNGLTAERSASVDAAVLKRPSADGRICVGAGRAVHDTGISICSQKVKGLDLLFCGKREDGRRNTAISQIRGQGRGIRQKLDTASNDGVDYLRQAGNRPCGAGSRDWPKRSSPDGRIEMSVCGRIGVVRVCHSPARARRPPSSKSRSRSALRPADPSVIERAGPGSCACVGLRPSVMLE